MLFQRFQNFVRRHSRKPFTRGSSIARRPAPSVHPPARDSSRKTSPGFLLKSQRRCTPVPGGVSPILGPAEGWVCPCGSLLAAIMGVHWVLLTHSPAYLWTSPSDLSDQPIVPSPVTRSKQTSWAQLPGMHLVFTCSLHALLAESD